MVRVKEEGRNKTRITSSTRVTAVIGMWQRTMQSFFLLNDLNNDHNVTLIPRVYTVDVYGDKEDACWPSARDAFRAKWKIPVPAYVNGKHHRALTSYPTTFSLLEWWNIFSLNILCSNMISRPVLEAYCRVRIQHNFVVTQSPIARTPTKYTATK